MGLFNFFKGNKEKRAKLSHLKSLLVIAMADGKMKEQELAVIAAMMTREGLTDDDLQQCINNPKKIEFVAPDSNIKKYQYLKEMILLMMIDGDLDEKEYAICKFTAKGLGYNPSVIDAMILHIIEEVSKNITDE